MKKLAWQKIRRIFECVIGNRAAEECYENTFRYRPDDVVIVSYPKSGSTWLRFIMANLVKDLLPDWSKEVDFLGTQLLVPGISREAEKGGARFNELPSPRLLRSHSLHNANFPRVVYLMRDGRDVLISYYHHFRKFNGFEGTLNDFICSDVRGVEWNEHVNSWIYHNPLLSNICVVKYEDLLSDAVRETLKIVQFVGLGYEKNRIREAVEKSKFDRMRQIERKEGLGYVDVGRKEIKFVRKGSIGEWREVFGASEKKTVKKMYADTLIKAGYANSYDW
jgi:Sulfotransferase domain